MQEYERLRHETRRPGEEIADAYLDWMQHRAEAAGVVLVAEGAEGFVGFVAGWIEETANIGETADSNRFGFISDICVMPAFRGRQIAARLLDGIARHLGRAGVSRLRIAALAVNASARASYEQAGFAPYEILYEKPIDTKPLPARRHAAIRRIQEETPLANRSPRVDYDAVAPLYDAQPHRARAADPEFLAFVAQRAASDRLSALDIGCGTGNQLVANRPTAPDARLVGIDRSLGMLRQARPKAPDIAWVQADAAALPFPALSFDFISCQFAFHHFRDKAGMLRDAFRVLRGGGRFVLRNLCPQESPDWLYYRYFPEAEIIDLRDFWPPQAIMAVMESAGFTAVTVEYEHVRFVQDLSAWLAIVRRRDTCSQLLAVSDAAYEVGLRRLQRELADPGASPLRADHLCLLTLRGDKPSRRCP